MMAARQVLCGGIGFKEFKIKFLEQLNERVIRRVDYVIIEDTMTGRPFDCKYWIYYMDMKRKTTSSFTMNGFTFRNPADVIQKGYRFRVFGSY